MIVEMMSAWCSAVEMVHIHGRKEQYFVNDCGDDECVVHLGMGRMLCT